MGHAHYGGGNKLIHVSLLFNHFDIF